MTDRTLVGFDRLWEVLGAESETLAVAVRGAPPEAGVPGCPGLTLGETARHVGSQYRMVWRTLRDGASPTDWQRAPAIGQDLADYVRGGAAPLLAELGAHDPARPCETWWPAEPNHGFWRRRMAHEATVHRYDVQAASGATPDPIPEDVALDGIDEILTLWFEHRLAALGVAGTRDQVVAVRSGGLEWVTRGGPDVTSTRRPGDPTAMPRPDATLAAAPMDAYLWLWGRRPDWTLDRDGSQDAIAQLWALLRLATR